MRVIEININDDGYVSNYEKFIAIQNENEATCLVFNLPDIYKKDGCYQYVAFTLPDGTIKVRSMTDYECVIDREITSQRGVLLFTVVIKSVPNVLDIETGFIMSSQPISGYIKKTILDETGTNSIDKNVRIYLDEFDALLAEIRNVDKRLASILDSDPGSYAEVIDARNGYPNLGNRLNYITDNIECNKYNISNNSKNIRSYYDKLINIINNVASGSPLVANSVSEMTDTSRTYVNTDDGNWYYYNGTNWVIGGVYQATAISENDTIIQNIKSDIDAMGGYKLYNEKGRAFNVNVPVSAGQQIVFTPVNSSYDSNTGLYLYGCYDNESNAYDSLGLTYFGKTNIITANKDYTRLRVAVSHYNDSPTDVINKFYLAISDNNGIQYQLSNLSKILSEVPPTITASNIIGFDINVDTKNHKIIINRATTQWSSLLYTNECYIDIYDTSNIEFDYTEYVHNTGASIVLVYDKSIKDFAIRILNFSDSFKIKSNDVVIFGAYVLTNGYIPEKYIFSYCKGVKINNKEVKALNNIIYELGIVESGENESDTDLKYNYKNILSGQKYRVMIWDAKGIVEPIVYYMLKDGTYTSNKPTKYINGMYIFDNLEVTDNTDTIRIYTKLAVGATNLSYKYAYCLKNNNILDYLLNEINNIDEELKKVKANNIDKKMLFNFTTSRIFKKVVCVGDSYTSGHIQLKGGTMDATNEEFSWVRFMENITGNTWINCGCSGCNVLTWQTHERGLPKAKSIGKVQAYVVGLMINDTSDSNRHVDLGTKNDIGTDAQTYYGGMSKIIRELNTISPNAKIFINTCPKNGDRYKDYNNAVREIVETYKDAYPVHCIDLSIVSDYYSNESLLNDAINAHYTAIGYEQFAEIYNYVLSDYINNNVSSFQDIYKVEYDE